MYTPVLTIFTDTARNSWNINITLALPPYIYSLTALPCKETLLAYY